MAMKHLREELWFNTPHRRDYINITDQVEALGRRKKRVLVKIIGE